MENNKEKSSPFGPEWEKPLKDNPEWKGFDFKEDLTLYQLFEDIFKQKTASPKDMNISNIKNKTKEVLLKIKNFSKNLTILKVIGILIIVYIGILIFKEIRPLSYKEQYINCLKLGDRAGACIRMLKN
jgi:hypothetical protein